MKPGISLLGILIVLFVVAAVVAGLIALLRKRTGRKVLLGLLVVAVVAVCGIFIMRVSHYRPVKVSVIESRRSNVRQRLESAVESVGLSAVWAEDVEKQFRADVYPSKKSAVGDLGRRLGEQITELLQSGQVQNEVVIIQNQVDIGLLMELRRTIAGHVRQKVQCRIIKSDGEIANAASNDSTGRAGGSNAISVSLSIEETAATAPWNHVSAASTDSADAVVSADSAVSAVSAVKLGSGRITATLKAADTTTTIDTRFVEKPWVDDFAGFQGSNPQGQFLLSRSYESCMSQSEADQQAMSRACEQVTRIVNQTLPRTPGRAITGQANVNPADLTSHGMIADRFAQQFYGAAGPIWRGALLLDISKDKLAGLTNAKLALMRVERQTWMQMIITLLSMAAIVTAVYAFLDMATRGYYTLALRIAALLLLAAVVIVVLNFA